MQRLGKLEVRRLAAPDQQISLTDPDARSMATSGRGSGMVGYNVQASVDTKHHLIVAHEVTNEGTDRVQLSRMAKQTKAALKADELDVVADRGYFSSEEILACEEAGITVTLPKPLTSGSKAKGRFAKQDFRYLAAEDVYLCPAGERLTYRYTNVENGQTLRRYWTNVCRTCTLKHRCTTGKERRIASCDALRRPERRPRLHDPPGWGRQASRLPARGRARPRTRFSVAGGAEQRPCEAWLRPTM